MENNRIVFHGCGGCGINILDKLVSQLDALGEGFCPVKRLYIDTTKGNMENIKTKWDKEDFFPILKNNLTGPEIDGSGGERRTNAPFIVERVKEYLDKNKFKEPVKGEFHIVVSSGSGGSGSVIAPMLVRNLIELGIPVLPVVIGDYSDGMYTKNTINTLATYSHLAVSKKIPLPIIYLNNTSFMYTDKDGINIDQCVKQVNHILLSMFKVLTVFMSGMNHDMDSQDIINMISQNKYQTVNIKHGLLRLAIFTKEVLIEKYEPTICRALTTEGMDVVYKSKFLSTKKGVITTKNVINTLEADKIALPLYLVTYRGFFKEENQLLLNKAEEYETLERNARVDEFVSLDSAEESDFGLVF